MNIKDRIRPYVIYAMATKLSEVETLRYLDDRGFKISTSYLYKVKKDILESRHDRLHLIAKTGYIDKYLEIISELESVDQELWMLYRKETNTFKKSLILEKIVELQNFMTGFYDSAQYVTQQSALLTMNNKKKKQKQKEENEIQEDQSFS